MEDYRLRGYRSGMRSFGTPWSRRRDLGQDQHGALARLGAARTEARGPRAARPCVDAPSGARRISERNGGWSGAAMCPASDAAYSAPGPYWRARVGATSLERA